MGGFSPAVDLVEEYNGSSWTNVTSTPQSIGGFGCGSGIQTAGLVIGGLSSPKSCLLYDGTNWSATASTTSAKNFSGAGGASPSSASIAFGGASGSEALTEEFTGAGPATLTISDS